MAHSIDIDQAPFSSMLYFIATILDPNYQLFWLEDEGLIEVECDLDDEAAARAALKAKLKGKY